MSNDEHQNHGNYYGYGGSSSMYEQPSPLQIVYDGSYYSNDDNNQSQSLAVYGGAMHGQPQIDHVGSSLSCGASSSVTAHPNYAPTQQQDIPVLGLKLTKTNSLLNIIENFKSEKKVIPDFASADQLKAVNFSALSIQIGEWVEHSFHEGSLVAKCYFKKRKLVWEILDGNKKKKIEFPWTVIVAIKKSISPTDDKKGILQIMLAKSPLFFEETNPQPRKHTNWVTCDDFTSYNASTYRTHTLTFEQGVLEKHYNKLIQADQKLYYLSQQPTEIDVKALFEPKYISFTSKVDNIHSPLHDTRLPSISFDRQKKVMDHPINNSSSSSYQMVNYSYKNTLPNEDVGLQESATLGTNIGDYHPHGLPASNLLNQQSQHVVPSSAQFASMGHHSSYVGSNTDWSAYGQVSYIGCNMHDLSIHEQPQPLSNVSTIAYNNDYQSSGQEFGRVDDDMLTPW